MGATRKLSPAVPKPALHRTEAGFRGAFFKKVLQFLKKGLAFWHRVWYYNLADFGKTEYGRLAQLVEHLLDVQEVTGSSPVPSTTSPDHSVWGFFVVCGTEREPEQVKAGYHHEGGILPFVLISASI